MNSFMTPTVQKWGFALFFLLGATILMKGYEQFVPFGVRYVFTDSIPTGLYGSMTYNRTPLARGQGVCFRIAPQGWVADRGYFSPGESVCKFVLGVPGDEVRPAGDHVNICYQGHCHSAGAVLAADTKGRPTKGAFSVSTVIPEGQYYLGSTYHPRSFDSRYLGLIDASTIAVRTWPLWTK